MDPVIGKYGVRDRDGLFIYVAANQPTVYNMTVQLSGYFLVSPVRPEEEPGIEEAKTPLIVFDKYLMKTIPVKIVTDDIGAYKCRMEPPQGLLVGPVKPPPPDVEPHKTLADGHLFVRGTKQVARGGTLVYKNISCEFPA